MDKNTEVIQHNFNQLYQGEQSKTFNEVEYLEDVAKLRHEILELVKKFDLVEKNNQIPEKHKSLLHGDGGFPDGNERIAKNGGFALGSFDRSTGIPKEIYTPFGAVSILKNDMYSLMTIKKRPEGFFQKRKYESNIKKFKKSLNKMLGLVDMQYDAEKHSEKHDVNKWSKGISKLPWKAVDLPGEIYRADPAVANLYERDERIYLESVFDAVNAGLCLQGHPECIIPGTNNYYSVNGQKQTISEMAAKDAKTTFTRAMDRLREIRNPLNARKYGMTPVLALEAGLEPQQELAPAEVQQVITADLGREM